jgi:hypothetical protein
MEPLAAGALDKRTGKTVQPTYKLDDASEQSDGAGRRRIGY